MPKALIGKDNLLRFLSYFNHSPYVESDIKLIKDTRNKSGNSEKPEYQMLFSIYEKLEKLAILITDILKNEYAVDIIKRPTNRASNYADYHWVKIYPNSSREQLEGKYAHVIYVNEEGVNYHIYGLRDEKETEKAEELSSITYALLPILANTELIELAIPLAQKIKQYNYLLLANNIQTSVMKNNILHLLEYKKQIILQGPPGTGKTRLAKEIAEQLTSFDISDSDFSLIEKNESLKTLTDKTSFEILDVNAKYRNIKVKSVNATKDYTVAFDLLLQCLKTFGWLEGAAKWNMNGTGQYVVAIAKEVASRKLQLEEAQCKLIQFHPSYTYEDFVRGIVAKPDEDRGIIYKAENKQLGNFAKQALSNYELSKQDNTTASIEKWLKESFEDFKTEIEKLIEEREMVLSENVALFKVDDDSFRYGKDWKTPARINFADFKKLILAKELGTLDVFKNEIPKNHSLHAHYRATYYLSLLRKFFDKYSYSDSGKIELKNYVLIIDEINRANLSSVLGELIYALEYRSEEVESMYEVDGSNKLTLPPNLYIIGTMNTADRSVGHIDYAIRRRFAFVDVLPEKLQDNDEIYFNTDGFDNVSRLFNKENVSAEFEIKDVQIGHSYFIAKKSEAEDEAKRDEIFALKMNYEVVPILLEYVRDGILIGRIDGDDVKNYVNSLKVIN